MGHANLIFWKAWEDTDLERQHPDHIGRSRRTLIVTGKVEVKATIIPVLEEDVRRIESPKTLYLKFRTLESGESWKLVWFQKEIEPGEYDTVQLRTPKGDSMTTRRPLAINS